MAEARGWFLQVYPGGSLGLVLWLLGEDGTRHRFEQAFPVRFYAAGPEHRLRQLADFLRRVYGENLRLWFTCRRGLFEGEIPALAVQAGRPAALNGIFYRALRRFPDLDYYDADIPLALRYAARYGAFPLAVCRARHEGGRLTALDLLEQVEDIAIEPPPVRVMTLEPDVDPGYAPPVFLHLRVGRTARRISVEDSPVFLRRVAKAIQEHDPDLILTKWGDTWLFPHLLALAERYNQPFNPNRDPEKGVQRREAFSYHTYGQVLHRGQQVHLFGRWHIDEMNAVMYGEYELLGVLEQARLTALPVQETARKSPGAGITAMQIVSALRQGILVPYRKQQAEAFKTPAQVVCADRGGLVGQPQVGLHEDVAGIDFFSMYPQLMRRFNISPETVGVRGDVNETIPGLDTPIDQTRLGFVGETLRPLLDKRYAIKQQLAKLDWQDYRCGYLKARAAALKWLLVVCFGYLGHKHFRWMRVEAYEAVTAFGREILLTAKETAERRGFRVLYFNVDGLYIKKAGCRQPEDFQPLLDEIFERTGMPIALDGIFRWIAFLPSRMDARVPVANRYFGVFDDGRIKVRGIEMRRHDTPPFVYQAQAEALRIMAAGLGESVQEEVLTHVMEDLRLRAARLRTGDVPPEDLLVTQRLSRVPAAYKRPSPAAKAAMQLERLGKEMRAGQRVRFFYTRTEEGVLAWQAGQPWNIEALDVDRYLRLLARAAANLLVVFGIEEEAVRAELEAQLCLWPDLWRKETKVVISGIRPG